VSGRAKLKIGEGETVDIRCSIAGRPVEAQLLRGDDGDVSELISYDGGAKAKFVDERVGEKMRFREAAEAVAERNVQGEVQVACSGGATRLNPE